LKFHKGLLFGIGVETNLDLPLQTTSSDPIVRIVAGMVGLPREDPDYEDDRVRIYREPAGQAVLAFAGGAARIGPNELVIESRGPLDMDLLVFFAWPLLLSLRGRESLHGCVVERNGVGIAVVGAPGSGKSTAALGLIELGYRLVADDLVVFDEEFRALPGPAFIRLRPDRASAYEGEWDGGGKMRYFPPASEEPVAVGRIVVLDESFGSPEPVSGASAADLLVRNLASGYLVSPQQGMNRFKFATEVARRIPIMGAKPRSLGPFELEKITSL